jgi:splicing factor 3B subunit 4
MASASGAMEARNQDATLWVGGLDERCDDDLVWELFVQAGPLVSVHLPADKVTMRHSGFAFVEFRTELDAEYAMKVLNTVKLFGKSVTVRKAGDNKQQTSDVGANLFVGNLAPSVDEQTLYATFGAFGGIAVTKIMRDPDNGESKGFGFVNFDSFEAADGAIAAMNGQYLAERPIVVQYAFRKDAKGERHGSAAERLLASAMSGGRKDGPHTMFSAAEGNHFSTAPTAAPMMGSSDSLRGPMLPSTMLPPSMMPPPVPGYSSGGFVPGAFAMPPPGAQMGRGSARTLPAWMTAAAPPVT